MDMVKLRWSAFGFGGLCLILAGCAQVGTPSGGAKDDQPPQLLAAVPPIGATSIETNSITLTFDEYVKAGQWRSELLVSPPIKGPMELLVRGREVELTWEGQLKRNTTYVWQFGKGIVDVNEGNAAKELVHAFSTGPDLDTLMLHGRVVDAIDGSSAADYRVMLFPEKMPLDSVLNGSMPSYVGATDERGRFQVGYLPKGQYRMLAIEDDSRNFVWDPGEWAAVGPVAAVAGDTTEFIMRAGETMPPSAPYMSEAEVDSLGFVSWKLSETMGPLDSLSWVGDVPVKLFQSEGDQIEGFGWNPSLNELALQMVWHHAPRWTADAWKTDTLDVPRPRMKTSKKAELRGKPVGKRLPGESPVLEFSVPIGQVNATRIVTTVDSSILNADWIGQMPTMGIQLSHEAAVKPGVEVQVTLLPGCLERAGSLETFPQDTLSLAWSVLDRTELGEWQLSFEGVNCPGLLELSNTKGEALDVVVVQKDTTLMWRDLRPGKVTATWWGDLDGDQVWRNVDVASWRTPEPLRELEPVEIRPNWVLETTWVLDSLACQINLH